MGVVSGVVTVATSGTAVAFPSTRRKVVWLKVIAADDNTGDVWIGDANVDEDVGYPLRNAAGETGNVEIPIPAGSSLDLSTMYVDAENNGDHVNFIAVTE